MSRPRLVRHLMAAERALRRWIEARAEQVGVGASGAGVLFAAADDDGVTVSAIAAQLNGSVSGASGLVDRLVRAGLVTKSRDSGDGRGVRVHLTAQGREAEQAAREVLGQLNAQICAGFTAEELATVQRWLIQVSGLATATGQDDPAGPAPGGGALR